MGITFNTDTFIPSGSGAITLFVGSGKVLAIIMSTEQTSGVQTVTLYDSIDSSGDILLDIRCPLTSPYSLFFATYRPLKFSAGLTVDPGNCNVLLTLLT